MPTPVRSWTVSSSSFRPAAMDSLRTVAGSVPCSTSCAAVVLLARVNAELSLCWPDPSGNCTYRSRGNEIATACMPSLGIRTRIMVSVSSPSLLPARSLDSTLAGSGLSCASVRLSMPTSRMSMAESDALKPITSVVLKPFCKLWKVDHPYPVRPSTSAETIASTSLAPPNPYFGRRLVAGIPPRARGDDMVVGLRAGRGSRGDCFRDCGSPSGPRRRPGRSGCLGELPGRGGLSSTHPPPAFCGWCGGKDKLTYAGNAENLALVATDPALHFVKGDITDALVVADLMIGVDAVVHFAAESHVDRSILGAAPFVLTNVVCTHTVLQAALEAGVSTFVHVSTDEVYGSIESGSWTEDHLLEPNSPYSASKAGSDLLARAYARTHGMDVRITRCSNNYGPYQYPEKVIPLFVTNLLDGLPVPLYGDGLNVRDWLHADDHCHGIALVLERGRAGEMYNIGGGTELTNTELTGLLLEATGTDWSSVRPVTDRKAHDRRYSVDWTKIRTELGYRPEMDFRQGLADTVRWYAEHRQWWEPLKSSAAVPG